MNRVHKAGKMLLGAARRHGEVAALLLIVFFASIAFEEFFTYSNLSNVLRQVSMAGLIGLGMTLVILTGGIDLSVGSVVAVSAILAARFSGNLLLALVVPLVAGLLLGALNGLLITRLAIAPFIATLATQMAIRGISYLMTGIKTVPVDSSATAFLTLGRGYIGPVPIPALVFLLATAAMLLLLRYTGFGRSVYAIGGNEDAARMIGLRVNRNKLLCYAITGLLAAAAGILLASRLGAGQPVSGKGWEMDVVASVAIGGTLLTGGAGGIGKTFFGVLILGFIGNIINLQGTLNTYWQSIITGAILLAAIAVQNMAARPERRA